MGRRFCAQPYLTPSPQDVAGNGAATPLPGLLSNSIRRACEPKQPGHLLGCSEHQEPRKRRPLKLSQPPIVSAVSRATHGKTGGGGRFVMSQLGRGADSEVALASRAAADPREPTPDESIAPIMTRLSSARACGASSATIAASHPRRTAALKGCSSPWSQKGVVAASGSFSMASRTASAELLVSATSSGG